MRIGQKLILGFVGIALLVGVVGYMAVNSLREITSDIREVNESNIREVEGATEMATSLLSMSTSIREYFLEKIENRPDEVAKAKNELQEGFENFEKALELGKKATEVGIKLAEEEEEEELKAIKLLEEEYILYKNDLLKTITIAEEQSYDVADKFYEDKVEKKGIALLASVRGFEEDAEEEIISEGKETFVEAKAVTRLMFITVVPI